MDTSFTIDLGQVAKDVGLPTLQVQSVIALLDDGNTIPFITRYRKDQTGGLDEERIRQIEKQTEHLRSLADRKQKILRSIESQGKLTAELADKIRSVRSTKLLEDLYLPFRVKKRTLATKARERGLEPLADEIFPGVAADGDLESRCQAFVDAEKELPTTTEVMDGVRHLIAERFSEQPELRSALRRTIWSRGKLASAQIDASPTTDKSPPPNDVATLTNDVATPTNDVASPTNDVATPTNDVASSANDVATPTHDVATPPADSASPSANITSPPRDAAVTGAPKQVLDATPADAEADTTADETEGAPAAGPSDIPDSSSEPDETSRSESDPEVIGAEDAETNRLDAAGNPRQAGRVRREPSKRQTKKDKKRLKLESAFKDFFDYRESLQRIPPHRILALNRGDRAGLLRVKLDIDVEALQAEAEKRTISEGHCHAEYLRTCLRHALVRLILPSLEREVRRELTDRAEAHAIQVFARNLRNLLLQPPIAGRRVLAIDPGFRSGCKLAALDEFGSILGHELIHIVGRPDRLKASREKLVSAISRFDISIIAIGNGTACRETETLVADVIAAEIADRNVEYTVVNEAGASVYSTSPLGREEMPELDATQRSAVSIGRRLLDPLSELVKINPANIGVGLYQHDVKAKHLRSSLDAVVESCVNAVGVDANSASPALLSYISGLNKLTARRIYDYRREHGPFKNRDEFKQVPGIGDAAYVQAAGFLKITGGDNPLDATWIHPESYQVAEQVLTHLGSSIEEMAQHVKPNGSRTSIAQAGSEPETVATSQSAAGEDRAPPDTEERSVPSGTVESATQQVSDQMVDGEETVSTSERAAQVPPDAAVIPETGEMPATHESTDHEPSAHESTNDESAATAATLDGSAAENTAAAPTTMGTHVNPDAHQAEGTGDAADRHAGDDHAGDDHAGDDNVDSDQLAGLALSQLVQELKIGELTLRDILNSLTRPRRDPREDLPPPIFRRGIIKLDDLEPGMELAGTVLNVVDFGAFVDIGLHDSGLIHVSRLANRYISDPHEVVSVGDVVNVWVVEVDKQRRRVSLTAIQPGTERPAPPKKQRRPERSKQQARPPRKPHAARKSKKDVKRPRQRKPPKPVVPITKDMAEGREPMRTFGDLKQFYEKKETPDEEPSGGET